MCGICGIVDFGGKSPDERLLRRMLGLIRHRGPDAFGLYMDGTAGLGSTRLKIIDLSGGDQPIHNEDGSLWIVYNGEVFNYIELRSELLARGHKFYTNTDTEVLVHLFEEKGPEMLQDLNGQFGLAIWDSNRKQMFLARDRMGIRPLFYRFTGTQVVFASEIKAIFADPAVERRLLPQTLSDIFTCWSTAGSNTPFYGILQLMPAHYALIDSQGMRIQRYWQIPYGERTPDDRPFDDLKEELKALLQDSCRIRLRADVPVGAYLSGGLDSTYTTSIVKRHFNNKLCTFSVAFEDPRFDESAFQQQAVKALRTDHRVIRCTDSDIRRAFPSVVWHAETPLLRTAPAPLYQLSNLVRENGFKVVLTGEGADELFAGYDIFKEDKIRRFWARVPESKFRRGLFRKLYPDIFAPEDSRALFFLENFFKKDLCNVDSPVYSHMIRWSNTGTLHTFFNDQFREESVHAGDFVNSYIASLPNDFIQWDPLSRAQYTESTLFLSNYLLSSQGDRMTMAHAVEGRFPFLDYRIVEFAARIPPRYRMNGLKDKYILRKAASELIPERLAYRQKQPYRAPIAKCFLGERRLDYIETVLSEHRLRDSGYFIPHKVAKLMHKARQTGGHLLSERENMALTGIISTQLIDEQFIRNFPYVPVVEPETVRLFDFRPHK